MTGTDGGAPATPPSPAVHRVRGWRDTAVRALHGSWLFTSTPIPADQVWELSKVDIARIPKGRGAHFAQILWTFLNWTERPALYVLVLLVRLLPDRPPIQGPPRYVFVRPTRRLTLYLFTLIAVSWLIGVL